MPMQPEQKEKKIMWRFARTFPAAFLSLTMAIIASPLGEASDLESGFQNPPHSAGIRAFWWWLNSNVTKEAITRDLEEMKAKGFGGALIFDADGSSQRGNRKVPAGPVFGSPEWTELFVHACQEAKRLDLELSLNIQSGWNLGGPKVTAEEATQTLVWSKTEVKGPANIKQALPSPQFRDFYRDVAVIAVPIPTAGTPRPIEDLHLKSATRELGMSAPDCRFLLNTAPALPGELMVKSSEIVNLSAKMHDEGTLRWDVPEGAWVVLRIGHTATGAHVSTQSAGWGGRVLDYMNPSSLNAYWNRNIEPLFLAIGPLAGTTLRYVHTDSWEGGGMNWTPGFDRTFQEKRGYDPIPWLAVLAGYVVDSREDSNAFLADFRKTIGDRVADHYGHLAGLARNHGMATHPECSGPHAGPLDGLKNYGRSELMMSEFWSPSPHRPHAAESILRQAGLVRRPHLWQRTGWRRGLHHDRAALERRALVRDETELRSRVLRGVESALQPHLQLLAEGNGHPRPGVLCRHPFQSPSDLVDEVPTLIDYFKRCQYLGQQGDFVADVVYYYGDHIPNIATLKESDPAGALPGFDYDVLSEELLLSSLTVEKGCLSLPSGMEYRVLVLPDHRVLSLRALKKVDELVRAGATVLGPKPAKAVSLEGGPKGKVLFQRLADGLWGPGDQADNARGVRKADQGRVAWGMPASDLLQADGVAPRCPDDARRPEHRAGHGLDPLPNRQRGGLFPGRVGRQGKEHRRDLPRRWPGS